MNVWLPSDTRRLFQSRPEMFESRSLFKDRFACAGDKVGQSGDERKKWFHSMIAKRPEVPKERPLVVHEKGETLYAQLQSRMMVNMAGGVMENAGLCLDRFGIPYIPGSAVKGCARRMAIHSLLSVNTEAEKVELLYNIVLVFGWGDNDWKPGRRKTKQGSIPFSDFWWAMCEGGVDADDERNTIWEKVMPDVARQVLQILNNASKSCERYSEDELPAFGGLISFLPAIAVKVSSEKLPLPNVPLLGELDLDVLTCHHGDYYDPKKKKVLATDDEDPNPVFFPAVAKGHVFCFQMLPLRNKGEEFIIKAREWLINGLSVFGIGAKISAGYGWFQDVTEVVSGAIQRVKRAREAQRDREREANRIREEEARRAELKRIQKERKSSMSPEELEDAKLDDLDSAQFNQWITKWEVRNADEKEAIYRFFQRRNPKRWVEIRDLSQKGKAKEKKRFGPVVTNLFRMAKERKERMPQ